MSDEELAELVKKTLIDVAPEMAAKAREIVAAVL